MQTILHSGDKNMALSVSNTIARVNVYSLLHVLYVYHTIA